MKATILTLAVFMGFASSDVFAIDSLQSAAANVFKTSASHSLVLTVTRKSGNQDQAFETTAVAVDESGLLATSLKALENANSLEGVAVALMGAEENKASGELTRVAWIRDDATEVEGELVLKDELLDLAIIRLEKIEEGTMPGVLQPAKAEPVLLEDVLTIGRLSSDFQRSPRVGHGRVSALVTTPRRFYQISGDYTVGTPVYNLKGEWIGLHVMIEGEAVVLPSTAIIERAKSLQSVESSGESE